MLLVCVYRPAFANRVTQVYLAVALPKQRGGNRTRFFSELRLDKVSFAGKLSAAADNPPRTRTNSRTVGAVSEDAEDSNQHAAHVRSEEHTSELQSRGHLV